MVSQLVGHGTVYTHTPQWLMMWYATVVVSTMAPVVNTAKGKGKGFKPPTPDPPKNNNNLASL